MDAGVGREPQCEVFADEFPGHAGGGFCSACYDRPACLALLGGVRGRRVLDAACGPGLYAAGLIGRGAQVAGFGHSPRMAEICRARVSQGEFGVHDLGDRIGWLPGDSAGPVLCALAVGYADDRVGALSELRRVLRPDGALVLARLHPAGDWLRHGGGYFGVRAIQETWSRGWTVRYWLAPLERTCEEISAAGFLTERLAEPRPAPGAAAIDPAGYERLAREPRGFIAFRLRPRT